MKRQFLNFFLAVILTSFALVGSGCVPLMVGAAGAGGIAFYKGSLVKNMDYSVEQIFNASLLMATEVGYLVYSDQLVDNKAVLDFQMKDGSKGKIVVDAFAEKSSRISIRIGTFGDQETSMLILENIEKRIK